MIGVDVGTSSAKGVSIDEHGKLLAEATRSYPVDMPHPGWSEQDPETWVKATEEVLSELDAENADGIGLTGQMHGLVALGSDGRPLRPAILWNDGRSQPQATAIEQRLGIECLVDLSGNRALAGFTAPKLAWLAEHEPDVHRRIARVLLPKDYVRFRLTGERAIDMADASGTLMLDVANRRWSQEMLQAGEIDERMLPGLFESPDVCGKVSAEGAAATGLKAGTPVVAGAGDQAAGATGMGIVAAGTVSATIGTSGVVFAATDRPALDPKGRLHTFCHAIPGRWHVMGVTQSAGLSLRWFRDQFGSGAVDGRDPYDRLGDEAATIAPGCEGLLWTPYLMGERTPHLDSKARAALVGLTASHTRAHVIRAILEGVAFSLRDSFTIFAEMNVPVRTIRLGGGGARSPLWRQIQADVYGHEIEIVEAEEGAAYGAAILAGVGAKFWPTVDDACAKVVQVAHRVPHSDAVSVMNQSYAAYRRVYPATKAIFNS